MKNGMQIILKGVCCFSYNLVLHFSRREESENHHQDSVQDFQTECVHHLSPDKFVFYTAISIYTKL